MRIAERLYRNQIVEQQLDPLFSFIKPALHTAKKKMAPFRQWQLPVRKDRKGIGSLQLVTLDETPQPEAGQVLVKVKAVSLNYRDLAIVQGTYPRLVAEGKLVPVSDGAGEVVQVGSGVTLVSPGQKVMAAFNILHLHGWAPDEVEANNGLGGQIDGMLTEFKLVSVFLIS